MANNQSQATLSPAVWVAGDLTTLLRATGAEVEPAPRAVTMCYVYWENGADGIDEYSLERLDRWDPVSATTVSAPKAQVELVEAWQGKQIEDVLRAVLEANPDIEVLHMEGASTCSKMRQGEFGGFGLFVTRSQYCWVGSGGVELQDGRLVPTATVVDFA